MKNFYVSTFLILLFCVSANAQSPCSNGRYANDTFTNVATSSNINFGSNTTAGGSNYALTMDIYQPAGDLETKRPLIVWAHGGSFIGGSKTDGDVVALSQAFAKKGYVCASINYRLGLSPFDSVGAVKAVLRAVQDMKASVRFFYKDKLTTDTYKIDTNNIFIGGSSAGAITALHMAYLDKTCEVNYYISPSNLTALGGMDGYSGNQCYSSKVKGVINLCGALGRYGWIQPGDIPFCSLHGTNDGTVKYNRGFAAPLSIPLILLDGSRMLKEQATAIGVSNPIYTWYGKDHVPYAGTNATALAYMDSTVKFVRDFLISNLGCNDAPLISSNVPAQTATLYSYTACTTNQTLSCNPQGLEENVNHDFLMNVYPNPSENEIKIEFKTASVYEISILDFTGKLIYRKQINDDGCVIQKSDLNTGIYFLKITNNNKTFIQKIVFY